MLSLGIPTASWAFEFKSTVRGEIRYDDNILRRTEGVSEVFSVVTPDLTIRRTGTVNWELRGWRSIASYYDHHPVTKTLSDHGLIRAGFARAGRESLTAGYDFVRSRDPIQFDERSVLVHGETERSVAAARVKLWRAEASARFREWTYQGQGLSNGRQRSLEVGVFPVRSRWASWAVRYRRQDLEVGRRGLTGDVFTVGHRREHSPTLTSDVEIGGAHLEYDDGSPDQRRVAGAVGLTHERKAGRHVMTAHLRLADDVTASVHAGVKWGSEAGRLSLAWERLLDVEGGVYQDPTLTRRWVLGLDRRVWKTRRLGLEGSYARTSPFRREGSPAHVYRASAFFRFRLAPGLSTRAGYDFYHQYQELPHTPYAPVVSRNRFTMTITASR